MADDKERRSEAQDRPASMTKEELVAHAQRLCPDGFDREAWGRAVPLVVDDHLHWMAVMGLTLPETFRGHDVETLLNSARKWRAGEPQPGFPWETHYGGSRLWQRIGELLGRIGEDRWRAAPLEPGDHIGELHPAQLLRDAESARILIIPDEMGYDPPDADALAELLNLLAEQVRKERTP